MFKELFEAKYNIDIHGKLNPYTDLDSGKLKKKLKSFQAQVADLRSKVTRSNLGSGGDKNAYFKEIDELLLKIDQVNFVLKGK